VSKNAKFARNNDTNRQGFGPRASHTGRVRDPMITGGNDALIEQSKPKEPTKQQYKYINTHLV